MRGSEEGEAPAGVGLDLSAVGIGTLAGSVWLVLLGLIQGMVGYGYPFTAALEAAGAALVQGLAALLGGVWAARRASGSGWLHGALAGLALAGTVACVMAVKDSFPAGALFLQRAGMGAALGALGGVIGVNTGRR